MFDDNFKQRQQYIRVGNELNKKVDTDIYIKGNQQKIDLDKKLEELSIQNNILLSGKLIRKAVLEDSNSEATSGLPEVVDTLVGEQARKEKEKEEEVFYTSPNYEQYMAHTVNKGKEIAEAVHHKEISDISKYKKNI